MLEVVAGQNNAETRHLMRLNKHTDGSGVEVLSGRDDVSNITLDGRKVQLARDEETKYIREHMPSPGE